ncbi:spindle and kinetochore-associated protein 2-like isoform X2 [Acanthaster planci]|uniref:Protein FAM33A n=1 Tax=Acanthaster planci TaxID=133434 RepID=A0A8B7Z8I9_ACAPL|nr:spindle and kinetochore-associated protein 2-like isoform X2 [Acanthaster planci]
MEDSTGSQQAGHSEGEGLRHDMANNVDKVEALFRKAESDLEYMSRKLEDEFRQQLGGNNQLNPSEMMQRLQRIKTEYNSLVQDAEGIKAMQSQMASYFRAQLQTACTAIKALQEKAPQAQITDSTEQEAVVDSILGLRLGEATDPHQGNETEETTKENPAQEPSGKTKKISGNITPELSQADKRARNEGFIPLSEEELQSVSPLVRGRVKLADVNAVYKALFEHFKVNGNSESLTIQDMSKKGLRITGATGEAKLKVLRALKILHMSRNGAVKLL